MRALGKLGNIGVAFTTLFSCFSCFPEGAKNVPVLNPVSRVEVANLSERPRDGRFPNDSVALLLDGAGQLIEFRRAGYSWTRSSSAQAQEVYSIRVPDLSLGNSTLTVSEGNAWIWHPRVGILRPALGSSEPTVFLPIPRSEDVYRGVSHPGVPRDHGRIEMTAVGMVLERRAVEPQYDSLLTSGYLVILDPESLEEDTLHSFSVSGYGRMKGGFLICCGRPSFFTPQAHWAFLGHDSILFTSGVEQQLLVLPLSPDLPIDSIPLWIEPRAAKDRHFFRYALKEKRVGQYLSMPDLFRYSLQLFRSKQYLREGFSGRTQVVTQLFAPTPREVWIRHFDPDAWEYGLSDQWTIVDLETKAHRDVIIPDLGVVLDIQKTGEQVQVLSSVRVGPGRTEVLVSTFVQA